jgi:hypothetical protein
MRSESIIDSRLHIRVDLDTSLKANSLFFADPRARAHLAQQLLLYDRILIPTYDFGIVPVLIGWMGHKTFRDALNKRAFGFLRRHGLLGYAGNGNGVSTFEIRPGPGARWQWWQEALFGESPAAVDLQLKTLCPSIGGKDRGTLVRSILAETSPVAYDNDFFMKNVVNETYSDIVSNAELHDFVARSLPPTPTPIPLTHLPGVGPDQLRVLNLDALKDAIDLVLRVAEINMELVMSALNSGVDIFASEGADRLLKAKLVRAGYNPADFQGFVRLLELNAIPDISAAVESGTLTLPDIWKLRQRWVAKRFRRWLRKAQVSDARELEKLYVKTLRKTRLTETLPLRVLRFGLTSALPGAAGVAAGAADTFLVDRAFGGFSPKLFFDRASRLFP